ncbi:MAG TPA: hypothetical protein VGI86_03980 [Acidimicrobiia bacterium]
MLLRATSQFHGRDIAKLIRLGGVALLVGGAAGPLLSRRLSSLRVYLDQQAWGWLDQPGRLMQAVGSTLIAGANRRAHQDGVSSPAEQKVVVA